MSTVRLQHPDLPGQIITVPDRAAAHHRGAGWEDAPDPEPVKAPPRKAALADAAPAADSPSEPGPAAPRRRASKEEQ